ncbi:heme exporter protein CcmD [Prosthecodimorpha staleyi]|uniref:Heme exporter protein D n=1 Tax=Prosthecodimorpha staleyi TaxID=2840188 RepID=A0A947DB43_9HYPH|nr:heme exporter protein CcmD [Prosthecodimorpha staleyi]MBT9290879.1 heme exporter protein CcmD [Prosthecodimorpha staleyi]
MAGLGPHWGFIVAAYLVTAVVVLGLIVWIRADLAAQRRTLKDLEARGLRRRSDAAKAVTPAAAATPAEAE